MNSDFGAAFGAPIEFAATYNYAIVGSWSNVMTQGRFMHRVVGFIAILAIGLNIMAIGSVSQSVGEPAVNNATVSLPPASALVATAVETLLVTNDATHPCEQHVAKGHCCQYSTNCGNGCCSSAIVSPTIASAGQQQKPPEADRTQLVFGVGPDSVERPPRTNG